MKDGYKELLCNLKLSPGSVIQVSDLKEGVWIIKRIEEGTHCYHLLDKVEDLPEAIELSKLEALRYEFSRAITDFLDRLDTDGIAAIEFSKLRVYGVTIRGMVNAIFKMIKNSKNVKK